jgi:hypothetical protein
MARFYGVIGYAGDTVETTPGVWEEIIVEFPYYGDVIRNTRKLIDGVKVNDDLSVNNSISVVADEYANENILAIRYIQWMGSLWTVTDVEVQRPRLLLRLGGVYDGPTPPPAPDAA